MKIIQITIFILITVNVKSDFQAQIINEGIAIKQPLRSVESQGSSKNPKGAQNIIVKFGENTWECTKQETSDVFNYNCVGDADIELQGQEKETCLITEPETGKFEVEITTKSNILL